MGKFLNNMYAAKQLTEDQKILLSNSTDFLNSTSIDISQRTTTPLSQTQSAQEYDFQQLQTHIVVYAGGDGAVLTRNNGLFQNLYSVGRSKENKQNIIDTFCHNLVQNHPVFRNIVHTELKTTLLKGTFAPGDSNIIKPHKGLGPLAMLAQPTSVISQLAQVVADQAWASTTTTSDHGKRKLGVARLPENSAETIALAQTMATILTVLFGPKCPLAQFLHEATRALTTLSQDYTGTDWVNEVGNTFIHESSNAATKFFEHKVVVSNFINHSPLEDFHDYLKTLKSGRLITNSTLPAFLQPRTKPPPTVPYVPPQDTGGNALKRRREEHVQNDSRRARTKTQGPTVYFTRTQPPAIRLLLDQLEATSPFWTLSSLRQANNIAGDKELARALGLNDNDCLKSCITGECRSNKCFNESDRKHHPLVGTLKVPALKDMLTSLLAKGT